MHVKQKLLHLTNYIFTLNHIQYIKYIQNNNELL